MHKSILFLILYIFFLLVDMDDADSDIEDNSPVRRISFGQNTRHRRRRYKRNKSLIGVTRKVLLESTESSSIESSSVIHTNMP